MYCRKRDPMYRLSQRFVAGLGNDATLRTSLIMRGQYLQTNTGRGVAIAAPLTTTEAKGLSIHPENLHAPAQLP